VDLLHCHFGDLAYYAIPLARHLKVPLITMFYGFDATMLPAQHPVWRKRYRRLFEQGDLFLVEGNNMKKTLQELGCPEAKIRVFHLGVDLDRFPLQERSLKNGEPLRLLAAGSFREKKGISYAVEAFARARKEFPRMTLTIIGDAVGKELEEKRRIQATIAACGIEDSVHFLGFQPHESFLAELKKHHLFISPSVVAANGDTEGGSPVAITEASAAGLPVISSFHCDIPEVVVDGVSGRLSRERDVAGLCESILYFAHNPRQLSEYGREGRWHVEENYNIALQLMALKGIYTQLLSGR
jgi:colanic acid/amylovoran biosynthesis glycosyltransferase